jgi:hypothetical protein
MEAGMRILILAVALNVCLVLGIEAQNATIRGWLSDEQCAGGRASGGVYTGTNPECAKQCVAKGAKIVLIVPDQKRLLSITNQGTAKRNIGDYVKVIGMVDQQANSIHIDSLKILTEGRAKCDLPKRSEK